MDRINFLNMNEEKIYIEDIPTIVMQAKGAKDNIATIVFYHGWSACKDTQRIRGLILAAAGYRVVIPDSINHGERNALDKYGLDKADKLWETVFNSMEEWPILIDGLADKYNIDKNKIGLMGNSMGGIIASGIYTFNDNIKALVVLNGSMAWENTNKIGQKTIEDIIKLPLKENISAFEKIEKKVRDNDPIGKAELLKNRPILLLHGDSDSLVPVESQRLFYKTIMPTFEEKDKIKFIEFPGVDHTVSTNMMEESILFFNKYI